ERIVRQSCGGRRPAVAAAKRPLTAGKRVGFSNRIPLKIEWGQCDPAGIVYNPRFFEWFDIGAWTLVQAALGVPRNELSSRFGIIGLPLVEAAANFKSALKFGDTAEL